MLGRCYTGDLEQVGRYCSRLELEGALGVVYFLLASMLAVASSLPFDMIQLTLRAVDLYLSLKTFRRVWSRGGRVSS